MEQIITDPARPTCKQDRVVAIRKQSLTKWGGATNNPAPAMTKTPIYVIVTLAIVSLNTYATDFRANISKTSPAPQSKYFSKQTVVRFLINIFCGGPQGGQEISCRVLFPSFFTRKSFVESFSTGACMHRFVRRLFATLLAPVVDRLSLRIRSRVSVDFACFCTTQYYGRPYIVNRT